MYVSEPQWTMRAFTGAEDRLTNCKVLHRRLQSEGGIKHHREFTIYTNELMEVNQTVLIPVVEIYKRDLLKVESSDFTKLILHTTLRLLTHRTAPMLMDSRRGIGMTEECKRQ